MTESKMSAVIIVFQIMLNCTIQDSLNIGYLKKLIKV